MPKIWIKNSAKHLWSGDMKMKEPGEPVQVEEALGLTLMRYNPTWTRANPPEESQLLVAAPATAAAVEPEAPPMPKKRGRPRLVPDEVPVTEESDKGAEAPPEVQDTVTGGAAEVAPGSGEGESEAASEPVAEVAEPVAEPEADPAAEPVATETEDHAK